MNDDERRVIAYIQRLRNRRQRATVHEIAKATKVPAATVRKTVRWAGAEDCIGRD